LVKRCRLEVWRQISGKNSRIFSLLFLGFFSLESPKKKKVIKENFVPEKGKMVG
jgi:hypothetical protein